MWTKMSQIQWVEGKMSLTSWISPSERDHTEAKTGHWLHTVDFTL